MQITCSAIVLNSLKYGDSSLISKLYTKEEGITTIISSISKTKGKSKFHHYLQPLSVVRVQCSTNKNQTIKRLKEIEFINGYIFDNDVLKGTIRMFMAELISKVVHEEESNDQLYRFIENYSLLLQQTDSLGQFIISFLCGFTIPLGIEPNLDSRAKYFDLINASYTNMQAESIILNEEDTELFSQAFNRKTSLKRIERKKAIDLILNYYRHQFSIELKLNSLDVLEEVFS